MWFGLINAMVIGRVLRRTISPDIYDDSNSDTEVEYVDSVTPNPGRVLEVDEGNDSIGVALNPEPSEPSENDEDVFGDEVPIDEDGGASGLRAPTSWDADEMEVGNQRLQREIRKLSGLTLGPTVFSRERRELIGRIGTVSNTR
jgi:hypothetical protein